MTASAPPRRSPVDRYLLPSERRVVAVRRHPAVLLRPTLLFVGALVAVGALTARMPVDSFLVNLLWYGVLAVAGWLGWKVVEWSVDRVVVTDRRILSVSGLLTRRVAMMPLRKVTDMTFEKPALGRLLGYGSFVLESAGQDQALRRIDHLPRPEALYADLCELMFGRGRDLVVVDEDDVDGFAPPMADWDTGPIDT